MFFLKILSRLPLSVLYIFSDFLFMMSYYVIGYRLKVVRKNLRNSFPNKSDEELKKIEKQFYRDLCDFRGSGALSGNEDRIRILVDGKRSNRC